MPSIIKNPYTGLDVVNGPFPTISRDEACAKLDAIAVRQRQWAQLSLDERCAAVAASAHYFAANKRAIAEDITDAVGKPLAQSLFEVEAGVGKMLSLCEQAHEALAPERRVGTNGFAYEVRRVPKGVIDIIAPWNYPVFTALNGLVPALLSGNAVSLKHESCPAIGAWFERAFSVENGCPVAHLVVDIPTSDWLAANAQPMHHRVFTGSVRGGRIVSKSLGDRALNAGLAAPFMSVSLELGGCDAAYVHGDLGAAAKAARLEAAVDFIINVGRLNNAGQSCCATKRLLVHPAAHDAVVARVTKVMAEQVLGDPMDAKVTIGPLFGGATACRALVELALDAHAKGARVVVGGHDVTSRIVDAASLASLVTYTERAGAFFKPTVLLGATPHMRCMHEESFGPLLPICRVPLEGGADPIAAALEVGRLGPYGLTASIWTDDGAAAAAFVDAMAVGTAFVNWCNDVHAAVVWSGVGHSGNGAGAMGAEGFRTLTNTKSVVATPAQILHGRRMDHAVTNPLVAQLEAAARRAAAAVARLWRAGDVGAAKDGIGVYKVPLCLAVDGQHGLASAVLDDICDHLQTAPGCFAAPPLPVGEVAPTKIANVLSEYRTYLDAVVLAGAATAQRWDVCSEAAIEEIVSRQHACGGLMNRAGHPSPRMPLSVTCMGGLLLLHRGRLAEARRAAEFVMGVIAANGDAAAATHFRFVGTPGGGVVTRPEGWMADRVTFEIDLSSAAHRFYHIGISAAFLAELYGVTGEARYLKAAEAALAFAERLPRHATACEHICKVGWGAALVFRETRSARWHDLAERVARETFLDKQHADGLYPDFLSILSDAVPCPEEAVAPGHEIAAEFAYEMHYLARGLSRAAGGLGAPVVRPPPRSRL